MLSQTLSNSIKTSTFVFFLLLQYNGPAVAQGPAATDTSGPVDIQANEQEFAGEQVIARGNVHVTYKDSVISSPQATLFRDSAGSPQKAVFTGHPKMTQGTSVINADTLTFEIANQRIIAEGRAHSEVVSTQSSITASGAGKPGSGKEGQNAGVSERIITDSDRQEYDKSSDKFEAQGHVRVIHGDIRVNADKLQLVYGADKKPETAIFTGRVVATENNNKTSADTITYSLTTKRLQASGHVKSQVIQKADASKKGGPIADEGFSDDGKHGIGNSATLPKSEDNETVVIVSDSQDYSQETGRLSADGNVKLYYQDTVGIGPRVILVRNQDGRADKVFFTGRSQVTQPGKRWIADRITLTVADKRVLAEGNTRAFILQAPKGQPIPHSSEQSRLAGRSQSISSTKVEAAQ